MNNRRLYRITIPIHAFCWFRNPKSRKFDGSLC